MKKLCLILVYLFFIVSIFGQSKEHFKIQKRVILKYKLTHNEKYLQEFINNWSKEIPGILDTTISKWGYPSQNSSQIIQALYDSTRYDQVFFRRVSLSSDKIQLSYLKDTTFIIIPSNLNIKILKIKIYLFEEDSLYSYMYSKKEYSYENLKYFKPQIKNRKTLYLTEEYKKLLMKNKSILKKINLTDYTYLKELKKKARQDRLKYNRYRNKFKTKRYKTFHYYEPYYGSYPINVSITFDRSYTYAFIENLNDNSILVCQKKEGKWYVIYRHSIKNTIIIG